MSEPIKRVPDFSVKLEDTEPYRSLEPQEEYVASLRRQLDHRDYAADVKKMLGDQPYDPLG